MQLFNVVSVLLMAFWVITCYVASGRDNKLVIGMAIGGLISVPVYLGLANYVLSNCLN